MALHCFQVSLYGHEDGKWISGIQMTVDTDRVVIAFPHQRALRIRCSVHAIPFRRIRNWFAGAFNGAFWCMNEDIIVSDDGKECEFRIGFPVDDPFRFSLDASSDATFSCFGSEKGVKGRDKGSGEIKGAVP